MAWNMSAAAVLETAAWYGVRVRSQAEQMAATALRAKGYEEFLPVIKSRRRWSDRVKYIDKPAFPGYVFCRFEVNKRAAVLQTPGVVNIVSFGSQPLPIPEVEIQAVRTMLQSSLSVQLYPFLTAGR